MHESRISPERDGLNVLFGDSESSTFEAVIASPAPASEPAPQYRSRREMREAEGRTESPVLAMPAAEPIVAPIFENLAPTRRSRRASTRTSARVRPVKVAYAKPAKRNGKKLSGLVTSVAVVGLFASVALPAYAMVPGSNDESTTSADAVASATLKISDSTAAESATREEFGATSAAQLRGQTATGRKALNYEAYMKSGALEAGDDYPYFSELSNNQGGGLSPLRYYYRECVDFVAWRLNRDAGSFTEPYKYDWGTLTPSGGNASQWKYAWLSHGWGTGTVPQVGAVAWYAYNHVAYVKAVNADGSVLLEEYNGDGTHVYGQRIASADSVDLYLYAPPR